MARFKTSYNVIAKADPQSANGVHFDLADDDGNKPENLEFDKSKHDNMGKKDDHEVSFALIQEPGMTLEFAQGLKDVLWVAWGDESHAPACPKTMPATCPDPIFFADHSAPNKLRTVNTNPAHCWFSFTLNFVDPHSQTPTKLIPFDPIGENKNGGIGRSDSSFALTSSTVALLIGVAVVLAIGYVLLT
jgi:hypothetical protein